MSKKKPSSQEDVVHATVHSEIFIIPDYNQVVEASSAVEAVNKAKSKSKAKVKED